MTAELRHDFRVEEVRAIHDLALPELLFRAQDVHRRHHRPDEVQLCALLSVKTGACQEDCAYCAQSARYSTAVQPARMLSREDVVQAAGRARAAGATRFCMGTAWRDAKDGPAFESVLDMVRAVRDEGLEACLTMGMLTDEQCRRLAEAGLTIYNHNIDTSPAFYRSVVTTHTQADRLATLARVRRAGMRICSGGIIGMGESVDDRCAMLATLAHLDPHPESVPINALVPIAGTPLADRRPVDPFQLVRVIATARIIMPRSQVRLSAGRAALTREAQVLCFVASTAKNFLPRAIPTWRPTSNCCAMRACGPRRLGTSAACQKFHLCVE
jgi:biotin synthase